MYNFSVHITHEGIGVTQNSSSTFLLPSIHEHWPVIMSKIDTCSSMLSVAYSSSQQTSLIIQHTVKESEVNVGAITSFFNELLELVSFIHEEANDFMASRFQENVWPILAKTLGDHMRLQAMFQDYKTSSNLSFTEPSEKTISSSLAATLNCIACICSARKCGSALVNLLPSMGRVCIPFLSIKGSIGDMASKALKSIIMLDCCCIYRDLFLLANKDWPKSPFVTELKYDTICSSSSSNAMTNLSEASLSATKRAIELLDFIEQMDEQELL